MSPSEASGNGELSTRRQFLRTTAATTALAAPYYVPASVFGAAAPSNRVAVGCIGVGNQGFPVMKRFLQQDDCQVVSVCDVNRGSYGYKEPGDLRGREPARDEVERYYAQKKSVGKYKGCSAYNDFRDLLARDDVDAVVIASPDHWHAIQTIKACEAGKDVYCEKPLGLTIGDQQEMISAVRNHHRILQTGSHERSNPLVRRACELVRGGYIGEVKRVVTHVGRHNKVGPGPGWQPMPIPDGFDYDLWLGPAPAVAYHKDRCLYRFRFHYDYAGGQITNFGAHSNDMAQWGLGMDETGPVSVEPVYAEFLAEGSLFNAATYTHYRCRYANGTVLECRTADPSVRCIFEGTEGVVRIDNKGQNFVTIPRELKTAVEGLDADSYYSGEDHIRNFLDCVKSREEPVAPVEVGHRSATVCHLGNLAIRLGTKLKWDPTKEEFKGKGSDQANRMVHRQRRAAWSA